MFDNLNILCLAVLFAHVHEVKLDRDSRGTLLLVASVPQARAVLQFRAQVQLGSQQVLDPFARRRGKSQKLWPGPGGTKWSRVMLPMVYFGFPTISILNYCNIYTSKHKGPHT